MCLHKRFKVPKCTPPRAVPPDEVVKYMAISQTQFNLFQSIYGSIYTCIWPKAKLPWFWNEFLEESLKTLDEGASQRRASLEIEGFSIFITLAFICIKLVSFYFESISIVS